LSQFAFGMRGASHHRAGSLEKLELGGNIRRKSWLHSDMRRFGARWDGNRLSLHRCLRWLGC
jgi:hypothetical protein